VINQKVGLLRVSAAGPHNAPYKGGYNCVLSPAARVGYQSSGGNDLPINDCSGGYIIDMNAYIQSGANPALISGATAWAQWWMRDSGFAPPNNYGFSAGLQFTIE
jgi:hypothetical protein